MNLGLRKILQLFTQQYPPGTPVANAPLMEPVCTPNGVQYVSQVINTSTANDQFVVGLPDNADGQLPVTGNYANGTLMGTVARLEGLNSGGDFDRLKTLSDANAGFPVVTTGLLGTVSRLQYFYNNQWLPLPGQLATGDNDALDNPAIAVSGVQRFCNGSGNSSDRLRYAKHFATVQVSAAGSTAIFTPAAGLYYRLLGYSIEISDDATLAVAGRVTLSFLDVAAAIGIAHVFALPNAAIAGVGSRPITPLYMGNGYRSAATATPLNANLTTALATGVININVALLFGTDP